MSSNTAYDALRQAAGRVRRTDRAVLRLTGADRATWLQGLVTNDVLAAAAGQRVYSAYLTPQGRMITDLWIVPRDDALLLDVPAPLAPSLRGRFDGLIFTEDVQVVDESATLAVWGVYGPETTKVASIASGLPDPGLGVPGFVLYLDAAVPLPADVSALPEVDLSTLEVLRIEAGVPRFLADMTEDTIPLEAGIEGRAISFSKGCYVGQELIVRVTQRGGGRVARRLVGLACDQPPGDASTGTPPASQIATGAAIHAGSRDIGHVTSAAYSPRLGRVIAMGYVHRDFVAPGTRVEVIDGRGRSPIPAVVTTLPFVAPLP
jgi:folate-binding protein YgfZ